MTIRSSTAQHRDRQLVSPGKAADHLGAPADLAERALEQVRNRYERRRASATRVPIASIAKTTRAPSPIGSAAAVVAVVAAAGAALARLS